MLGLLAGLLLLQSLRLAWLRGAASRRVSRHRRTGEAGERGAKRLLGRQGFQILGEQVSGRYEVLVDGEAHQVNLRADFLVEKEGRRFVAEVKSGEESVKVTGRATRRQLLEYLYAFEVSGILLVDMRDNEVRRIEFPLRRHRAASIGT